MLRFSLLGSGSSGNAMLVSSPSTSILIDNGLSFRQLDRRVRELGENLDNLRAVFITHEHGDHVNGVGVLARRMKDIPIYATEDTFSVLPKSVGRIPRVEYFEAGDSVTVDGMTVSSFSVSHDAADPVSYVIRFNGCQLGVASDLGRASNLVLNRLEGSHALVLESNYCPEMLRRSSYPPAIQQRIRGPQGHLSNEAMNSLLARLLHNELKLVVLVHVSQENNTAALARDMASRVLQNHAAELVVAEQDCPTPMFEVRNGNGSLQ